MRRVLFAAALMAALPALATAQSGARGSWEVSLGGGATIPLGTSADLYQTGFHGAVGIGYRPLDSKIVYKVHTSLHRLSQDGFTDVRVLTESTVFNGTRLSKTGGQHGDDKTMAVAGELLGSVAGVVFQRPGHKTVYVAGDTVWNRHVEDALQQYKPDVIILNTGYARIQGLEGSIIMGKEDLLRAHQAAPKAMVIGTHMEAVNHGMQTRKELRDFIAEKGMDAQRVRVPADGEIYHF